MCVRPRCLQLSCFTPVDSAVALNAQRFRSTRQVEPGFPNLDERSHIKQTVCKSHGRGPAVALEFTSEEQKAALRYARDEDEYIIILIIIVRDSALQR